MSKRLPRCGCHYKERSESILTQLQIDFPIADTCSNDDIDTVGQWSIFSVSDIPGNSKDFIVRQYSTLMILLVKYKTGHCKG